MSIAENIARIRERMAAAARRAGRDPREVALMAVCKTMPAIRIREACVAGQRLFGENRVQEFQTKHAELSAVSRAPGAPGDDFDISRVEFHLIGHLQSNKAAKAVAIFHAVDSLDSLRLAERLNAAADELKRRLPVLVEINIGGEEAKSGVAPDAAELRALLQAAPRLGNLEFRGLMTVPPFTEDPEDARPFFCRLRALREELAALRMPQVGLQELSMGMSHDFEVAIEEGSTCVRVGTAIFGEREHTP